MTCPTGKHQFKTNLDAVIFNKANGNKTGEYFNVYRCTWCNDFHLASRSKKVKRIERI
jgi:Mor family transcriptional regulator